MKLDNKNLFPQLIKESTYRVLINYSYKKDCVSSGAGFFINKNHFLTCFHVVFGAELVNIKKDKEYSAMQANNQHEQLKLFLENKKPTIQIKLKEGLKVNAILKKFDAIYDVALLEVNIENHKVNVCLLDDTIPISYGEKIAFGGFPNQFSYTYNKTPFAYHEGIVSSFPTTFIGGDSYEHLQINSINLPGNSGAPLFIEGNKKVVGIINGNMNWGRDDLLATNNAVVSNRIPLSITYATTIKTLKEKTSILEVKVI